MPQPAIRLNRIPFLLLAFIGLITGLWTGLNRLGWFDYTLPPTVHHGAVMLGGFLGTLIALEKGIPLKKNFLYVGPVLSGASVLFFFVDRPQLALLSLLMASVVLIVMFSLYIARERKSVLHWMMLAGAVCWLVGNIFLLLKHFYPLAVPWWIAFILFIIAAERLELTKFLPVSRQAKQVLPALFILMVVGLILSFHGLGKFIFGMAISGVSIWLLRNDIIGITLNKKGLPRFTAVALLCGYCALLLAAAFILLGSDNPFAYDTVIHTFFLGFTFSMIFAHGPIILPGVLGMAILPYHPVLYAWLALLHVSWIIRDVANFALDFQVRKFSGIISLVAILAYFITVAVLTVRSKHEKV